MSIIPRVSQKNIVMSLWAGRSKFAFFSTYSSWETPCCLISGVQYVFVLRNPLLFDFWCVVMDPCFIQGYETAQILIRMAVERRQTLLRNFHTIAFLIDCEQTKPVSFGQLSFPKWLSKFETTEPYDMPTAWHDRSTLYRVIFNCFGCRDLNWTSKTFGSNMVVWPQPYSLKHIFTNETDSISRAQEIHYFHFLINSHCHSLSVAVSHKLNHAGSSKIDWKLLKEAVLLLSWKGGKFKMSKPYWPTHVLIIKWTDWFLDPHF